MDMKAMEKFEEMIEGASKEFSFEVTEVRDGDTKTTNWYFI